MSPLHSIELYGFSDPISSWLHLIGALIAAASFHALVRRGRDRIERGSLAVFGVTVILALVASGTYHLAPPDEGARETLRHIDHAAIWTLIAGTFTPVHAIMFRGAMRWGVIAFIWTGALAGVVLKLFFFDAVPDAAGFLLYLGFAGFGGLSAVALGRGYGRRAVLPLLYGGVVYSVGGAVSVFAAATTNPHLFGSHEAFHIAVLVALVFHWRLMLSLGRLRGGREFRAPIEVVASADDNLFVLNGKRPGLVRLRRPTRIRVAA